MMGKRTNKYLLTLRLLSSAKALPEMPGPLELEFENHDEVFGIIGRLKAKDPFGNEAQAVEFAIGLKLFSEVMIHNRSNPLFEELQPAFQSFMKRLKSL